METSAPSILHQETCTLHSRVEHFYYIVWYIKELSIADNILFHLHIRGDEWLSFKSPFGLTPQRIYQVSKVEGIKPLGPDDGLLWLRLSYISGQQSSIWTRHVTNGPNHDSNAFFIPFSFHSISLRCTAESIIFENIDCRMWYWLFLSMVWWKFIVWQWFADNVLGFYNSPTDKWASTLT